MVLQYLLRNWATQLARQHAMSAMKEAAAGASTPHEQPAWRPVDVAIVFALSVESGCLVDRLTESATLRSPAGVFRAGKLGDRRVVVAECGVGREAAARGVEALIEAHEPAMVISAGFAGGLVDGLARGDIVLADGVVAPDGERLAIDLRISREAAAATRGLHIGRLATVDQIVRTGQEKRRLGRDRQAIIVDMETFGVAEVCRRHATPLLSVRVISDTVEDELPHDIDKLVRQTSLAGQLGAAAGAVWRRPSSVKDMLGLKERALAASDRLAKFLEGMVEQLKR